MAQRMLLGNRKGKLSDFYFVPCKAERFCRPILLSFTRSRVKDFLLEAKQTLSRNAYLLLEWMIGREWEGKNKRTPTVAMAVKYFNVSKQAIERAWEEIGTFWNGQGSAFYA